MFSLLRRLRYRAYRRYFRVDGMPFFTKYMSNVIQLGVGFLLIFSAFNSCGFIQQTVINNFAKDGSIGKHDGYISLSIIYAVFTLANFVAAPIVAFLNAKWSIVCAGLTYALFQSGFLYLNKIFLYISSALLGLGAAVIWTAQGKYLSLNSTDKTAGKNSGIFWAISQACLIFGGIFLFVVFHFSDPETISLTTLRVLYGVFTGISLLGVVIMALLPMPSKDSVRIDESGEIVVFESPQSDEEDQSQMSNLEIVASTVKLCGTKQMAIMILAFVYTGLELSFWSGIYPTCISSTKRLGYNTYSLTALNAITQGLGQAISGFFFGIFGSDAKTQHFGRHRIVILGAAVHLVTFALVYINFPNDAPLGKTDGVGLINPSIPIALLCGFLLGFGDACWNTQIFAFLIARYPRKSAEAFSLFKFFQSLLTCVQFYVSQSLHLEWHLLILTVTALLGVVAFYLADRRFSPDAGDAQITSSTAGRTLRSGDEGGIQHVD